MVVPRRGRGRNLRFPSSRSWGERAAPSPSFARSEAKGTTTDSTGLRASRKRAAIELIRSHERTLRRTARRYSLCRDDADDAYQRALEILLTKAPTEDPRQLIRWMQTVTKHEALALRRNRERILGRPAGRTAGEDDERDWVEELPFEGAGPLDVAERHERIARSREALRRLKPQELRALTLKAEGYSYTEIGEITGWTYTKINRCMAEGRKRFLEAFAEIEEGRRCEELGGVLSAFCDGEVGGNAAEELRLHLRVCVACRAKLRAFRAAPEAAAALAPVGPASQTLSDRAGELLAALQARLPGQSGAAESALSHAAATGGTRGAGMAALAKVLAACVGTAGGAAACVAAGVVPPVELGHGPQNRPAAERPTTTPDPAAAPAVEALPTEQAAPPPTTDPTVAVAAPPPAPSAPPPAPPPPPAEFSPEATASVSSASQPAPSSDSVGAGFGAATGSGTGGSGGGASVAEFGP
jgi:RNA polymerase sigma factor (sigma-70 family)